MVSVEEGFLSPQLFSKPINKDIYINKKKLSHPEFPKHIHPFDLISESAECVQQMSDISNNCGRKNNYANMDNLSRRLGIKVYKLNAPFCNYRKTNKKCNSVPYVLDIPEDYQISIQYYILKRQKSSQFSSRSFHSLLTTCI